MMNQTLDFSKGLRRMRCSGNRGGEESRQRLHAVVHTRPGILVGEAAKALGLDYATVMHHARILHRAGYIVLDQQGSGYGRSSINALFPPGVKRWNVASKTPCTRETLRLLRDHPGISLRSAAKNLGVSVGTVSNRFRRLRSHGWATQDPTVGWCLTEQGRELLS